MRIKDILLGILCFFGRWLHSFAIAITFGTIFGAIALALLVRGKLRVRGYGNLLQGVGRGVIIASNHPTALETILIQGLLCPWYYLAPSKFFIWNMPREGLVSPRFAVMTRCITITRGNPRQNAAATRKAIEKVRRGWTILIFAEGTRTVKGRVFVDHPVHKLCRIETRVPTMAQRAEAYVLPLRIDVPNVTEELGLRASLGHVWREGIVFNFGRKFMFPREMQLEEANRHLEQAILAC
ncbi:MAG: 1-acyl-sn-glycerol-3-phosphate acyltransferase [Candidatus Kaiserbacteria bacterium]|nr:1-acyl-sn-glycerol-3-phosphate acyltransferase [Candidatus Kaiserbacteria bacterium]